MSRQMMIPIVIGLLLLITTPIMVASDDGTEPVPTVKTSVPIMPLKEVKPGMRGTIKTVFRGDQIEEFGFEVLGVMKSVFGPKEDVILVKLLGQKPEFTGVVAGMSGSPVYIDGRLIGALSLRFGLFTKEPIAGITPIESMLPLLEFKEPTPPQRAASGPAWRLDDSAASAKPGGSTEARVAAANGVNWPGWLEPIPTPLFFSGFRQDVMDRFAPVFQQHHLVPLRAGSGSRASLQFKPENAADFVPGAPVSAVLVAGDLGLYATGTLSYRDGDRVLAFGHPFFQIGGTEMPMAKATILTTLASELASFKIAELGETIGTIQQDRLTAIVGRIGVKPAMIPVSVQVHSPNRGVIPYQYEIFHHPTITPLLFNITLATSVLDSQEQSDEMTIEYAGTIHIEGHPDVKFQDVLTSSDRSFFQPVSLVASRQIQDLFARLYGNGYETPKITKVDVTFKLSEQRRTATIEELRVNTQEVRPGQEMEVQAVLRPYRGDTIVKTFKLKIPASVTRGSQLGLSVSDAATLQARERSGLGRNAGSLDNLIAVLNRKWSNDQLYLRLADQSPGYFIDDRLLPSLPLSVISVIGSGRTANEAVPVGEAPLLVESTEVGYVVSGSREITLRVR